MTAFAYFIEYVLLLLFNKLFVTYSMWLSIT